MKEHENPALGASPEVLGNSHNYPRNVRGWTLRKTKKGYFEAARRFNGKLVSKYLGRDWRKAYEVLPEDEPVPEKPDAKEETPTIQAEQAIEHAEQPAARMRRAPARATMSERRVLPIP